MTVAGPRSTVFGLSEMLLRGPTTAESLVGASVPTVKKPRICVEWGSQTKEYRPSVNVTVQVTSCAASIGVDLSTPGPLRWKLCISERSLTAMS